MVLALMGSVALDARLGLPRGTVHRDRGTVNPALLCRLRIEAGLTPEQVADRTGKSVRFVNGYEAGVFRLRDTSLARVAAALGVFDAALWRFPVPDAMVAHLAGWHVHPTDDEQGRLREIQAWYAGEHAVPPPHATITYVGSSDLARYLNVPVGTFRKWWERYQHAGFPEPDVTLLVQRGQIVPGWLPKRRPAIQRYVNVDRLPRQLSDDDLLASRAQGVTWPDLARRAGMSVPGVRYRYRRLVATRTAGQ